MNLAYLSAVLKGAFGFVSTKRDETGLVAGIGTGPTFIPIRPVLQVAQPNIVDNKLTVSGGHLLRGGKPFRHVGINCHDLFADLLKSGTKYLTDLPAIAAKGVRIIRISAMPFTTSDIQTYVGTVGGSPVSTYLPALRLFLDECQKNGISVSITLLWGHYRVSQAISSTEADYSTANSKTRKYNVDFASLVVKTFAAHPAVACWAIGNEWGNYVFARKFLTSVSTTSKAITGAANNGSGLIRITSTAHEIPSGYTFPVTISGVAGCIEANGDWKAQYVSANTYDLIGSTFTNTYTSGGVCDVDHKAACIESINEVVAAIRKYDSQRAIMSPTGWNSWYLANGDFSGYIRSNIDLVGNCDVWAFHMYPDLWNDENNAHAFLGEDQKAAPGVLAVVRAESMRRGKALIIEECNAHFDNPVAKIAKLSYDQASDAGIELIMDWGWYADPTDMGLPNLKTTRNAVMDIIATKNAALASDQWIKPIPVVYPVFGKFPLPKTRFVGTAVNNNNVRVANSPAWQPDANGKFSIMFSLEKMRKLSANSRVISCNSASGGYLISASGTGFEDQIIIQFFLSGSLRGTTLTMPLSCYPNEQAIFLIHWDGAQQIHIWKNGVYCYRENLSSLWVYGVDATRSLYFGANADGSSSSAVALSDVIIGKGVTPTTEDAFLYATKGIVPAWAQHRWKLDGNALDSIGSLHGVVGSAATFGNNPMSINS